MGSDLLSTIQQVTSVACVPFGPIFAVAGSREGEAAALAACGDLERAAGHSEAAKRSYLGALAALERSGDSHQRALVEIGLAHLASQAGDDDLADELSRSAQATLASLGAPEAAEPDEEGHA